MANSRIEFILLWIRTKKKMAVILLPKIWQNWMKLQIVSYLPHSEQVLVEKNKIFSPQNTIVWNGNAVCIQKLLLLKSLICWGVTKILKKCLLGSQNKKKLWSNSDNLNAFIFRIFCGWIMNTSLTCKGIIVWIQRKCLFRQKYIFKYFLLYIFDLVQRVDIF